MNLKASSPSSVHKKKKERNLKKNKDLEKVGNMEDVKTSGFISHINIEYGRSWTVS